MLSYRILRDKERVERQTTHTKERNKMDIIEQAMIAAMQSPECYETAKNKSVKNNMGTEDVRAITDTLNKERQQKQQALEEKRLREDMM